MPPPSAPKSATKPIKVEKSEVYLWEGTDRKGQRVKGETRASSPEVVRGELRRMGISPLKVNKKPGSLFGSGKKKILPTDIAVFARQLATMMAAGVPLVQSFDIVGRGHSNPSVSELILSIKADIEGGNALHQCLRKFPLYFDDLFCNLVEAGEHAGVLDALLDKIATYKEKTESIKAKIKKAMFYPVAVLATAVIVTAVIMIFVIPQFKTLFSSFGADLPAFTLLVMSISDFMVKYWYILGAGIGGSIYTFGYFHKRSRAMREFIDRALLKTPVVGELLHKSAIARFARTLSTMFTAGVPLVEALSSVSGATGNIVYANAVLKMRDDVATGQSLQLAMKQQNIFPHLVIQMAAIGEESGRLDDMLSKVADTYEEEVDNMVDAMSSLMEPIIMVVLGGLIGGLVVAMYLPIFKLAAAV